MIKKNGHYILTYLKNRGPINTFRLATELDVDRHKILDLIRKLEKKGVLELKFGTVKFLKFPIEKEKLVRTKKAHSKLKNKVKRKSNVEILKTENERLKEKLLELEKAPPKVIRITKVKKTIQKVPVKSKKLKEQAEHIKELEEKIKELQSAPPKIIRRTIIKKVPVKIKEYITKTIVKKVPVKRKGKKKVKRKPIHKTSKFAWLKNIQKLVIPRILKK